MQKRPDNSQGFTLIAALMLTVLLSGVAVGLLFMVSNEARMGGNDLEGNMAYYAAEAQIENLTSELSQLYQTSQSPNAGAINALWTNQSNWANNVPGSNISNITYVSPSNTNQITWPATDSYGNACPNGNPCGSYDIVGSGQDQGMLATLIPFTLTVTATRQAGTGQVSSDVQAASGAALTLTRTVEVALLPAFEFGVFCDGDCDYFAGPNFNFGGRVHTNGSLFLASGSSLTFTDKIAAVGQVVMDQLENGHPTSSNYTGKVYVPNAAGGCPAAPGAGPAANCLQLTNGSWTGGFPPIAGSAYSGWTGISKGTFAGFIENGLTGATKLQLPFVNSANKVGAIDIIRKPTPGDTPLLASSRLYKEAAIRILLADTEADLYAGETRPDTNQDVQLGFTNNLTTNVNVIAAAPTVAAGTMYFANAQPGSSSNLWTKLPPTGCNTLLTSWPLFGQVTSNSPSPYCNGAWLRVEYYNGTTWVGVTNEWLSYGFGRNYDQPPTHPYNSSTGVAQLCQNYPTYPTGQCQNGISPAILILQQLQSGKTAANGMGSSASSTVWLPINFYDSREGEPRDTRPTGDTGANCSPNGIMNAVELDVGNLWLWLQASGPYGTGSGKLVSTTNQYGNLENGYILYFADHRGMIPDPRPITPFYPPGFSGMSGLNDTINSSSSVGVPDGTLEPITYYATAKPNPYSPEDTALKSNGLVDNWGQANLGAGFGIISANMKQPYYIFGSVTTNAVQCYSASMGVSPFPGTAEWNMVTGPRHVLRLVDGGMDALGNSYLPSTGTPPITLPNGAVLQGEGGFTVASEEPVYVLGNYNTGPADPFWPSENTTTTPHSAAAIIADAVTLLSNPPTTVNTPTPKRGWYDQESFKYPQQAVCIPSAPTCSTSPGRQGNDSYYRVAIAAGKSIPFPHPSWGGNDMGTDGGMHNFLRYLEDRSDGGDSPAKGAQVNYAGSLISMYYSQYATGIFKCCNSTYSAPVRNYFFDTQFLNPNNLPPGTPSFQDVVSLSYHESFTPQ